MGLGLWDSFALTIALESALFVGGVWLYVRATRPRSRAGSFALWTLLAVIELINVGNIVGPPPEDIRSPAVFALARAGFPE